MVTKKDKKTMSEEFVEDVKSSELSGRAKDDAENQEQAEFVKKYKADQEKEDATIGVTDSSKLEDNGIEDNFGTNLPEHPIKKDSETRNNNQRIGRTHTSQPKNR